MKNWVKKKSQSPIVFALAWIMYEVKRARECNGVCSALLFLSFLILAVAGWLWLQHSQGNFAFFTVSIFFFSFFKHPGCFIQKTWKWSPWLFRIWFLTKFTRICWTLWWLCRLFVQKKKIIFLASEVRLNVSGNCEPVYEKETKLDKKTSDCPWQENGPHVDELFVLARGRTSALWSDWLTVFIL